MTTDADDGRTSPLVKGHYYEDGARWERDIYRRLELSRNSWRVVSVVLCLALFGALWSLLALIPLKSTEVVTLLVDKATGFVEVARPLEEGGPISQREAVTQAAIVRYIRARETYDPPALRDNFELASLLSAANGQQGADRTLLSRQCRQSGEALGSDGTHQGLRQERELSDERLDAKPKNAGDGRRALHDDAHHGARANRSALGGERALSLHERTDEKRMAFRQSARLPGDRIS